MAWLLRWIVFVILGCLSLAGPIAIVVWSAQSAFGDKSSDSFATESLVYNHTAIHGDELWYVSLSQAPDPRLMQNECRIRRLNLETGEDVATGIVVPGDDCKLIWLADSLYIFRSSTSLYRWDGASLIEIPHVPTTKDLVPLEPFVHDGQLTMLNEFQPHRFRLQHLIGDHWVDGREIAMPTSDQFKALYSEAGQAFIQMYLTSTQRPLTFRYWVQRMSGQPRLVIGDVASTYKVFREGFQFVDAASDIASAIRPENAPPLLYRWQAYDPDEHQVFMARSISIPNGDIIGLDDGRICRREFDEEMQDIRAGIGFFDLESMGQSHLLTNEDHSKQYLLVEDGSNLQRVAIQRIEGDSILTAHVWKPGIASRYVSRWKRLLAGVAAAWMLHLTMILASLEWVRWSRPRFNPECDLSQVPLASQTRRALAKSIDLFLVMAVLFCLCASGFHSPELEPQELCYVLREIEWFASEIFGEIASDWGLALQDWESICNTVVLAISEFGFVLLGDFSATPSLSLALSGLSCLLLFLYCRLEGLYGLTPGKWLVGVRVLRSDLRPIGFSRSLLRTVLMWIDLIPFVTPFFAAVSLLFSNRQQRVGDRLADSIVVRRVGSGSRSVVRF